MPGLFPDYKYEHDRPYIFDQKIVFITARVHACETATSFMMDGLLELLTNNCEQQEALLKNFVFVLIPMLNPDGVYRGNHLCDGHGTNLNRIYNNPNKEIHPQLHAVNQILQSYTSVHEKLYMYIDLHASES